MRQVLVLVVVLVGLVLVLACPVLVNITGSWVIKCASASTPFNLCFTEEPQLMKISFHNEHSHNANAECNT